MVWLGKVSTAWRVRACRSACALYVTSPTLQYISRTILGRLAKTAINLNLMFWNGSILLRCDISDIWFDVSRLHLYSLKYEVVYSNIVIQALGKRGVHILHWSYSDEDRLSHRYVFGEGYTIGSTVGRKLKESYELKIEPRGSSIRARVKTIRTDHE